MGRKGRRRKSPPVGPSLSGEGPGARSPAREGARHRGSDAFGRRIREGDLPRLPAGAGTRSEAPQGPRFQDKLQAGNGKRMKSTACSARGRKARPSWPAPSRGSYRRPQGCHEVKSPRHLQLRWRPSDPSDGGERVARASLWRSGPPGSKRWVSAPSPGMRLVPGIRRDRGDAPSSSRGMAATARVSDSFRGGGGAHRSSCSHDRDFR